jgi:hypothetical protein
LKIKPVGDSICESCLCQPIRDDTRSGKETQELQKCATSAEDPSAAPSLKENYMKRLRNLVLGKISFYKLESPGIEKGNWSEAIFDVEQFDGSHESCARPARVVVENEDRCAYCPNETS